MYKVNRWACSIEMGDHVIVTGGRSGKYNTDFIRAEVSVYNGQGWVEDWPSLDTERQQHGCGHYINSDNNVVIGLQTLVSILLLTT